MVVVRGGLGTGWVRDRMGLGIGWVCEDVQGVEGVEGIGVRVGCAGV